MTDFDTLAATSTKLATGKTTAAELCDITLARLERINPTIGAYSDILAETAMMEAAASDERRKDNKSFGPLDGIPIAIKDLIDTTPAICKAGLTHRSDYRPDTDAMVVERLRLAGCVVIGVTETDPGAFSTDTPQVINPLATNRTVGGSSGGSAAAVAGGLAYGAIGTDTGGSIRIPAACCSIYGLKPTWGRVDTSGVMPLAPSLDHVGPLARSVLDLQLIQTVLDPGLEDYLHADLKSPLTIGIAYEYFFDAEAEILKAMAQVADRLAQASIRTISVGLPAPDDILKFHMVNLSKEAADFHLQTYPNEWASYPEIARSTVEKGLQVSRHEFEHANQLRMMARAEVDAALENVDAIIVPVMPVDAPLRDVDFFELGGQTLTKLEATIRYTSLFNQTGHPVISMPAISKPDGRSINLQLVGRTNSDGLLLALARKLQDLFFAKSDHASIMHSQKKLLDFERG